MRLLDQIVRSSPTIATRDRSGKVHRLPGVACKSTILQECALRYILDARASEQCFALVRNDSGLLEPGNPLLRLPAQQFWVEWFREEVAGEAGTRKMGALVEADETGRRGEVTGFFQNERAEADLTIVSTHFDLDRPLSRPRGSGTALKVRHGSLPHLNRLFDHALFHLDPSWEQYLRVQHGKAFRGNVQALAETAWFNLPALLAFTAMLNSPGVLDEHAPNISRLNRARTRRGKSALLDHVEVRLRLPGSSGEARSGPHPARSAPRLHHVRGHFVHRFGRSFWRSPHLRGDADRPILLKTVTVVGGSPRDGREETRARRTRSFEPLARKQGGEE